MLMELVSIQFFKAFTSVVPFQVRYIREVKVQVSRARGRAYCIKMSATL